MEATGMPQVSMDQGTRCDWDQQPVSGGPLAREVRELMLLTLLLLAKRHLPQSSPGDSQAARDIHWQSGLVVPP